MNNCFMTGRLTRDPELRRTPDGVAVCTTSVAVKRPKTKDVTDFFDIVVWRQGAEYLTQYGHKGDVVAVSGCVINREWTDNNGNKRKATEISVDSVELISKKEQNPQPVQQRFDPVDVPDSELPF